MAITWEFTTEVTNLSENRIRQTGTRTDDGVVPTDVWSETIDTTVDPGAPAATRDTIAAVFQGLHEAFVTKTAAIAAKVDALNAALKNTMETWEGTR